MGGLGTGRGQECQDHVGRERGKMELMEGMWGETAIIEGYVRSGMETSRNFLKYMKVILMKSPNSEGD